MVQIEWKEPPAEVVLTSREQLVAALKANPGKWARVKKDMKSKAGTSLWRGLGLESVAAPAESDPSRWDIYARAQDRKPGPGAPGSPVSPVPGPAARSAAPSAAPAAEPGPVKSGTAGPTMGKPKPLVAQRVQKARPAPAGAVDDDGTDDEFTTEEAAMVARQWRGRLGDRG